MTTDTMDGGDVKREIEREPRVPSLPPEAVALLTVLCFRSDDEPQELDALFVFGTSWGVKVLADVVVDIIATCQPGMIYLSGGHTIDADFEGDRKTPEAEQLKNLLEQKNVETGNVRLETTSTNCLHNLTHTLKLYPQLAHDAMVGFLGKTQSAGREFLILKKYLPNSEILQYTWIAQHYEQPITADSWHTFEQGRQRVWGEFLRIKKYGERGDIAYPEEVREVVERIEKITNK